MARAAPFLAGNSVFPLKIAILRALRQGECILYVDAEVPNGTFDLCVAEQYLHCAQVTCLFIDDRCLGSAKRMRPVILPAQSDPGDPLINEASMLPSADMIGMIDPAWKDEVVERAAAAFKPRQNTAASRFEELELNGSACFLLNDDRACTNPATAGEIADLDFNDVAPRSLLSIARSNIARSRRRRSRSSQNLMAQTCCGFSARLPPSFRPTFHGRRSLAPGSYSECPIAFLLLAILGQKKNGCHRPRAESCLSRFERATR